MFRSQRQGQDAFPSVAAEATLVGCSRLCNTSSLFRRWWLQEQRWASGVPHQVILPSLLLFTDACWTGWEVHLLDLTAEGTQTSRGEGTPYQYAINESLLMPDHGRDFGYNEQQCHGGVTSEKWGHNISGYM